MALPIQTPRQGVFGDSVAVAASVLRDGTKLAAETAEIVPGFPAVLGVAADVDKGKLKSTPDALDVFYGAFIQLPINVLLGRTSLGEVTAQRGTVERIGRIRVRDAVFQDSSGTGSETTIKPFFGGDPNTTNVGELVDAREVAAGPSADNPFTTALLKWQLASVAAGTGFNNIAFITDVSDDGTEVELELLQTLTIRASIS